MILRSHKKQTIKNIKKSGVDIILSIQDTSDISYSNLKATKGLGDYCGAEKSKGLKVHTTIAVTPNGIIQGILNQKIWARDPAECGKLQSRHKRPIEDKESFKWLESMEQSNKDIPSEIKVINICDREADVFEFFNKAINEDKFFLVRAMHNRIISDEYKMLDKVHNEKPSGEITVEIPRDTRSNVKKRMATLEVKYSKVVVPVPPNSRKFLSNKD